MSVRLQGDDELDALLMEMGGSSAPTTTPKDEEEQPESVDDDPRLTWNHPIPSFPKDYGKLKEGLTGTDCSGWKTPSGGERGDHCETCHGAARCHRFQLRKSKLKSMDSLGRTLWALWEATRNLRCASVANSNANDGWLLHASKLEQLWRECRHHISSPVDRDALEQAIVVRTDQWTKWKTTQENALQVLMQCDRIYYRIYYAGLTGHQHHNSIPTPPIYFAQVTQQLAGPDVEQFVNSLHPNVQTLLVDEWGLLLDSNHDNQHSNPLYDLWKCRWKEMHLYHQPPKDLATVSLPPARPHHLTSEFAIHETLAHSPSLADWRDVARDFPASLYSYATPSPKALESLGRKFRNQTITEVGAGTGYWTRLLRDRRLVTVRAFDLAPPGTQQYNEYHGEVPAFTTVLPGDASVVAAQAREILFLCYPPPGVDMALSALRNFSGSTVVHVGEWAGLTGDAAFERALRQLEFGCTSGLSLPSWGTDAAHLTVWERGAPHRATPGAGSCLVCTQPATRRCRYARLLQYCTFQCFEAHREIRPSYLKLYCLQDATHQLDFGNDHHFHSLVLPQMSGSGGSSSSKSRRKKKKRRKQ